MIETKAILSLPHVSAYRYDGNHSRSPGAGEIEVLRQNLSSPPTTPKSPNSLSPKEIINF